MTKREIAEKFKRLGGVPASPTYWIDPDGTIVVHNVFIDLGDTVHPTQKWLPIPSEQECREEMERRLPDGWTYELRGRKYGKWICVYSNNGFDPGKNGKYRVHVTCGEVAPSEAYLLAAQWLKEQQEPKQKRNTDLIKGINMMRGACAEFEQAALYMLDELKEQK